MASMESTVVDTMYNSEDTCKTMSLHVRRLNASLPHIHPLVYNVYKSQPPNSFSLGSTPASTTNAAWAHLRALRDTVTTCHGSPDLGEGSSRAHTCTTCPWNAKRRRQDYGCTCMCGDSRGCRKSSGDIQAVRVTHRVHSEL